MNKKTFRSVSRYSLIVTIVIVVLVIAGVIVQTPRLPASNNQPLATDSASSLRVQNVTASSAPEISSGASEGASSSGTISLQPAVPSTGTGSMGIAYPCNSCPEASSATDIMVCTDYCASPTPGPTPTPNPSPVCDPCPGNTYGSSDKMIMCPMIACRNMQ